MMIAGHIDRVLDVLIALVAQLTLHAHDVADHVALLGAAAVEVDAKVVVERRMLRGEQEDERLAVPERGREDERASEHVLVLDARVEAEQAAEWAAAHERVSSVGSRAKSRVDVGLHVVEQKVQVQVGLTASVRVVSTRGQLVQSLAAKSQTFTQILHEISLKISTSYELAF